MRVGRGSVARIVLPAISAFVLLSFLAVTPADADLWGHLTFGRDIVRSAAVHTTDPYSFTGDQPWINHEWLAEATMWTAWRFGGPRGLVALKLLLACLAALAILAAWRPLALTAIQRDALLCLAAVGTWPQIQAMRPQVFSIALFAWLLWTLERIRGDRRWLLVIPPVFALWVNLHGGWIVGAMALAAVSGALLLDRGLAVRRKAEIGATLAATALATLCNPYGTRMVAFLAETVRPDRSDIAEWHPLFTVGVPVVVIWLIPAAALALVLRRQRRVAPASSLLICAILALGSLRVYRLLGFFTVAIAVLLLRYLPLPAIGSSRAARAPRAVPLPARSAVAIWLVAFGGALALFGGRISANADCLPEPQAAAFISSRGLHGRMLMWFDYGEYAIWHLSPAIRVSMDGRRETVYSANVRDVHARIYAGEPEALAQVDRLNADHAWLPRTSPAVALLERHGWHRLFDGPRSVVLSRTSAAAVVRVTGPVAPRWFPGP